ncbi:uncharacterized protein LOC115997090 [Ipomoea triloba]|uniref:uncharacterized protein LOC115997090 n=1 Tax=Ipomoea triloba TaxID=35885 RepID=UPI00125E078F|nr:uncharacterized protein LOC115997090 [Ipomoea triloba]
MHLLDIATTVTTRPVCQKDVCAVSSQLLFCNRFKSGKDIRFASVWKSFCVPEKAQSFGGIKLCRGGLMIRAVATLEKESTQSNQVSEDGGGYQSSTGTSIGSGNSTCSAIEGQSQTDELTKLDEIEKLRRSRISKANKGKTPWNKGRKHSPETLQKIKERTRIAMRDPKVRMKLVNFGHAQSEETRLKIGVGVRAGWEKRQKMLKLQETCCYEWQNLIAEASRKGLSGQEELQWNSYKILNRQLEKHWMQSVEQRKTRRQKGNKRAPKSAEQRRKIAEAIAAKWADPDYRNRVCSSLAKFHGTREGVERKPRRKPSSDGQTQNRRPPNKKVDIGGVTVHNHRPQTKQATIKKSYTPKYKDPLAHSKLEMLRNIRARRAVADNEKIEAVKRAKLLIAEAEKAAKALEVAARQSPVARASLVETRNLIAEAIQFIDSIDMEEILSGQNEGDPLLTLPEITNVDDLTDADAEHLDEIDTRKANGAHVLMPNGEDFHSFNFTKSFHGLLNGNETAVLSSSDDYDLLGSKENLYQVISSDVAPPPVEEVMHASESGDHKANEVEEDEHESPPHEMTLQSEPLPNGLISQPESAHPASNSTATTKQWIRGRLVDVAKEG